MNLFGFNLRSPLVRAAQEIPMAVQQPPAPSQGDRRVPGNIYDDWWLSLPDKMEPKQVASMLRAALAGNLWQQAQLSARMIDSWPMLRKCAHELRAAVAASKYVVHPYADQDQEPTPRAKEKADLIRRTLGNFKPNRFSDEEGRQGMLYDLAHAVVDGLSICELLWDTKAQDPAGQREYRVRASAWVHPRHYGFNPSGLIGIAKSEPAGMLSFPTQVLQDKTLLMDPQRFLVAKFKTKSGSPLSYGYFRTLAYYWCTVMYGRDFMLAFAQKYGNGFLDIAYEASVAGDQGLIGEFNRVARRAAAQGWCVHDARGKVTYTAPPSLSGENANIQLMRIADDACQMLLLGQTLTSSAPVNGGTRAQGEVHLNVRDEKIEEVCKWVADILTEQFAETLLAANYRETSERPTVEVDLTRPLTAQEKADFIQKTSGATIPLPVEPVYKILDLPVPQPGEKVLVRGEHVVMEKAVTATKKRQQLADEQFANESRFAEAMGQAGPAQGGEGVQATAVPIHVVDAIKAASPGALVKLRAAVAKACHAKQAGHLNGELAEVNKELGGLGRR